MLRKTIETFLLTFIFVSELVGVLALRRGYGGPRYLRLGIRRRAFIQRNVGRPLRVINAVYFLLNR